MAKSDDPRRAGVKGTSGSVSASGSGSQSISRSTLNPNTDCDPDSDPDSDRPIFMRVGAPPDACATAPKIATMKRGTIGVGIDIAVDIGVEQDLSLGWYREMGGERLTLGSDAHRSDDMGAGLPEALEAARLAGFRYLTCFERRQARMVPIE